MQDRPVLHGHLLCGPRLAIYGALSLLLPCLSKAQSPVPVPAAPTGNNNNHKNSVLIGVIVGIVGFIVLKSACLFYVCYWRKRGDRRSRILNAGQPRNRKLGPQDDGSLQDWELDLSNVHICTRSDGQLWELGHGGFGRVFKGVRAEVQPVAIKTVVHAGDQQGFVHEIKMLKFVSRDRNIVQFYGAGIRNNQLWLVTEYMEGGDLRQALSAEPAYRVTWWNGGKPIAMDIARGLAFLHANKVIHRDLKSKNILLTADGQAKIGDVGMAKIMSEGYFSHNDAFGTFAWAAPELLLENRCTERVDIYSLGVVIWEIVTGELPQRGSIMAPKVPSQCPPEVARIIEECMRRDPSTRPNAGDVYRRLAMCPPNPRKSPILDSAEEQIGMAHMANNEKQLMELMARLSHDGNGSSLQSNKTPSVYSFGQNGSSDSGALSHATMSGIQEGEEPQYHSGHLSKPHNGYAHIHAPASENGIDSGSQNYNPNALSNTNSTQSSAFTGSTTDMDSIRHEPQAFTLSPNGDVVVEIDGLPRRLPVDGAALMNSGQQPNGKSKPESKAKSKNWLRR